MTARLLQAGLSLVRHCMKHAQLTVFVITFAAAALLSVGEPIWSVFDESMHFDLAVQYASGQYPRALSTHIRPITESIDLHHPVIAADFPPFFQSPTQLNTTGPFLPPPHASQAVLAAWFTRHLWQFSGESFETPLYYVLLSPFIVLFHNSVSPTLLVHLLRLVNALLIAFTAVLGYMTTRLLIPKRSAPAMLSGIFIGILPGFVVDSVPITDHTLLALCTMATAYGSIALLTRGVSRKRILLLALAVATASISTLYGVCCLVPALLGLIWARAPSRGMRWKGAAALLASSILPVVLWAVANKLLLGEFLQPQGYPSNYLFPHFPIGSLPRYVLEAIGPLYSGVLLGQQQNLAIDIAGIPLLAVPAFIAYHTISSTRRRTSGTAPMNIRAIALLGAIAGIYLALTLAAPILADRNYGLQARLAIPGIPSLIVLAVYLCTCAVERRTAVILTAASLFSASVILFYTPSMLPSATSAYIGSTATLQDSVDSYPISGSTSFGGFAIQTLKLAVDAKGRLWIELRVTNHESSYVDWSPQPAVQWNTTIRGTHSSQCPVDIAADTSCTEWDLIGTIASKTVPAKLNLIFPLTITHHLSVVRTLTLNAQAGHA